MKKYNLIILLSFVAVGMGIIKIVYKEGSNQTKIESITPTPTASQLGEQATPTIDSSFDKNYPLWRLLPFSGEGFTVEKYVSPLTLSVGLSGANKKTVIKELEKLFEENKIATDSHKLVWEEE